MNSNSDNPKVGKDFQRKVLSIAQKTFNMPFDEESCACRQSAKGT